MTSADLGRTWTEPQPVPPLGRVRQPDGSEEGEERWANLLELRSVTTRYDDLTPDDALDRFPDRGVAGFRLDAVPQLFEDPRLRDERPLGGVNDLGDPILDDGLMKFFRDCYARPEQWGDPFVSPLRASVEPE